MKRSVVLLKTVLLAAIRSRTTLFSNFDIRYLFKSLNPIYLNCINYW